MTTQLKSINTSILVLALVTFALMTGQTNSSNASERLDHGDEIINNVYTPLWMGSQDPSRAQGEVKAESNRYVSEQLHLRDEMIDNVYIPLWMGSQDPSF